MTHADGGPAQRKQLALANFRARSRGMPHRPQMIAYNTNTVAVTMVMTSQNMCFLADRRCAVVAW